MDKTIEQPKTGVGSAAETNRLLGGSYFSPSGSQIKSFSPTPINAENLSNSQTPVTVPSIEPSISPTVSMVAKVEADQNAFKESQDMANKAFEGLNGIQKERKGIMDYLTGRNSESEKFYQEALKATTQQIDPAQKELNDIRTKEADTLVRYRAETDAIKARGDITQEAQQGLQFNADDKYGRVLADLAIRKSAQIQNVADLREGINQKLSLQLGPLEREQKFFKDFVLENLDQLSDEEKSKAGQIIEGYERRKKEITDKENGIANILSTALENGVKIPDSVVSQVLSASSLPEATAILARNGISLQDPLERESRLLQLQKTRLDIQKLNQELSGEGGVSIGTLAHSLGVTPEQYQQLPNDVKNIASLTAILQSKIGQGTRTQIANALGVIKASEDMATSRQTSGFKGISPLNALLNVKIPFTDIGLPFRQSLKSKEGAENEGYINAINLKVQQWASGAALTKQQTEQVERFTPSVNDTDEKVRTKLNNLVNFMYTQAAGQLQSEGINYSPEKVNLFETYELLKKASPEQIKQLKDSGLIQ